MTNIPIFSCRQSEYKRMAKVLVTILLHIVPLAAVAAIQPQMGGWRTHMAYANISEVVQTADKIYGLSAGSIFSIDKRDFTIEIYSKLSGLNDTDIRHIAYSEYNRLMLVIYENSNIDIITDDAEIINISDIYRKTFNGDKTINSATFAKDYAYIATGYGISVINLSKYEIADSYMIGDTGDAESITDVQTDARYIYALTTKGMKYAPIQGSNLANYQNWNEMVIPEPDIENRQILSVNDTIFLLKGNNNLYRYTNGTWSMPTGGVTKVYHDSGIIFTCYTDNTIKAPGLPDITGAYAAVYDAGHNALWYSTIPNITRINLADNTMSIFAPNGPLSNYSWEFAYCDNRMFVVPGGRFAVQYLRPGTISFYEDGVWHNVWNYELANVTPTGDCLDLVDIEVDPNDKTHFFAASFGMGLYEFRNDQFYKLHNIDTPNGIETYFPNGNFNEKYRYQRVDALQFDASGNLWMFNFSANQLKVLDTQGKFHYINHSDIQGAETLERIIISKTNPDIKIVSLPRYKNTVTSALFVFDDRGTIDKVSDDRTRLITELTDRDEKNISLSQRFVRCIEQDKNGTIWVGTTEGILLLNNIEDIFNPNYRCSKIKISRDDGSGLADYLLETEEITDIVTDGANRKWIGTRNSGVYLVSPDGQTTIHHFTEENSPLLSNNIITLGINDRTGEVFIGTGKGIISYQSDSNEGGARFNNVHAFPNPVRPEFKGIITVTGLTDNSSVRITDVNGNMVYETRSYGGYATWDGCRANGDRVATGIYFAHCVSEDRKDKTIVKIMIIN